MGGGEGEGEGGWNPYYKLSRYYYHHYNVIALKQVISTNLKIFPNAIELPGMVERLVDQLTRVLAKTHRNCPKMRHE